MDNLVLLILLHFAYHIYIVYLKPLNIVNLDYVVSREIVHDNQLIINMDLNDSLQLRSPDFTIQNPKINIRLPCATFPKEQDFIGFDYELQTVNRSTGIKNSENIYIRIQLFDTLDHSPRQ